MHELWLIGHWYFIILSDVVVYMAFCAFVPRDQGLNICLFQWMVLYNYSLSPEDT